MKREGLDKYKKLAAVVMLILLVTVCAAVIVVNRNSAGKEDNLTAQEISDSKDEDQDDEDADDVTDSSEETDPDQSTTDISDVSNAGNTGDPAKDDTTGQNTQGETKKEEVPSTSVTVPETPAVSAPEVNRNPGSTGYTVVIDPGHQSRGDSTKEPNGPSSSVMKARVTGGTRGVSSGVYEYQTNLTVALQLKAELQKRGYQVYMTRESHDVNISNMERAQYAANVGADIAVRLHCNGVNNASVSGALALAPSGSNPYVAYLSEPSIRLSRCVLNAYCNATGMRNQGVSTSDTMTGINWSAVPVTILEMGYMTNSTDDLNMQNAAYQQRMVYGIADGIDDYFGL